MKTLLFTLFGISSLYAQTGLPIADQSNVSQYKYELQPIKWDIGVSAGEIKPSYVPKVLQNGDNKWINAHNFTSYEC